MKVNTNMPAHLNPFFQKELQMAADAFSNNNLQQSWLHLGKAHIIGQRYPYHHTLVHWKMFVVGIKTKNLNEIIGQLPRLLVGGIKSFIGIIPIGNTGRANVPILQPMEIPEELKQVMNKSILS